MTPELRDGLTDLGERRRVVIHHVSEANYRRN
jgi:hypothetical protein